MALDVHNLNLFGLDLAKLPSLLRSGWAEAMQWPWLSRVAPVLPVRVVRVDGHQQVVSPVTGAVRTDVKHAEFAAVLMDDDDVLVRELVLPDLAHDDVHNALALEVGGNSPFGLDNTVWGWRSQRAASGTIAVSLAMTSRQAVEQRIRASGLTSQPEVWAQTAQGVPVILQGFGETQRQSRERSVLRKNIGIWLLVALAVLALLASPFLQLRQQVFEAQERYAELERRAGGVVHARGVLQQAREQLAEIDTQAQQRADLPQLMETLAQVIPDNAYLIRLTVQGRQVQLAGQGVGVSALMEKLGAVPSFRELRLPAPISQVGGTNEEQFTVEFTFHPEQS